ncbi:hypothetical protein DL546_003803 [Coniochaeta pulveracea]|uniref:C3H1-type domain-containing protein n=1 Tax=Coniochaeta pulveracea TaxID=177199 RepID=A0A420Y898_9PEZI|nr:hypothetical protein DL546_003803 [Coniochaeta pulveracea]
MSFPSKINAPGTRLDGRNIVYPCKYLMNNKPCGFSSCSFSHDPSLMHRWKAGPGKKPCRLGPTCSYLQRGVCLFDHARHRTKVENNIWTANRSRAMTTDLLLLTDLTTHGNVSATTTPATIRGGEYLGSFNKLSSRSISIPGHPPLLDYPSCPLSIALSLTTPNFPTYDRSFEPLLHAIHLTSPDFNLAETELVTTATNLRKLFVLVENKRRLSNRFDIELRGDTMFLAGWAGDPSYGHAMGCWGWAFKTAICRFARQEGDGDGRVSHHRVEGYEFGGLRCVVQTVVDGYLCDEKCKGKQHRDAEVSAHFITSSSGLHIHHSGGKVPAACLVDVRAESVHRPGEMAPEVQRYFARRRRVYTALRCGGVFVPDGKGVLDTKNSLETWEVANGKTLTRMTTLLRDVKKWTVAWHRAGIRRFSLVCKSDGLEDAGVCKVELHARMDGIKLVPEVTGVDGWDEKERSSDMRGEKERDMA